MDPEMEIKFPWLVLVTPLTEENIESDREKAARA